MRTGPRRSLAIVSSAALAVGTLTALAAPAPAANTSAPQQRSAHAPNTDHPTLTDDLPDPLSSKQSALRKKALADVLSGKRKAVTINGSTVVKMGTEPTKAERPSKRMFTHPQQAAAAEPEITADSAPLTLQSHRRHNDRQDRYVELSREKTDNLFVILVEFGNERDPNYPDEDSDPETPGPYKFDGPLHGNIPQPDRTKNNSTIWSPNFDKDHYRNLYFNDNRKQSLTSYYQKQSSGRYSVEGEIAGWVQVPYNEARYGRNISFNPDGSVACQSIVCPNVWHMVEDGLDAWVAKKKGAGMTTAEIKAELAKFDEWDRYDYDGDGNFNEPDGYIDHFQILHAGAGEAAGAPVYGEDAVWSHSWYVNADKIGVSGPSYNPYGGYQIGDTGMWVGNYLTEPENAGLGVLAHEYGHDLGLPDEYDTTYTGEASSAFWTLMSSGSYMSLPQDEGIGTRAVDLNAWDKLQLGWLDYIIATPGMNRRYVLGPAEYNSRRPQGMVVVLPDKEVTYDYGDPYAGAHMWWSTKGNQMTTTMTHAFDLSEASSAEVTLKSRFSIETGYDFLYAEVSTDGGATWTALDGTVNGAPFSSDAGGNPAITGSTDGEWADVSIPLDAYAGQQVEFRFRYATDPAVAGDGFFADNFALTADGETVYSDGAEEGDHGWSLDGFKATTGTETVSYDNFYIVANRNYVSYDKTLEYGPYNFGFPDRRNWVEHYPYQDGVLISYWDTSYVDNNVGQHPGHGLILPIDAHPRPVYNMEGQAWNTRIQVYDATFGTQRVDSFMLHVNGKPSYLRGGHAVRMFNDHRQYWYPSKPDAGVKVPETGTHIKVQHERGTSVVLRVKAPAIG